MKTIINKHTREVLYNTFIEDLELPEDQEMIDFVPSTYEQTQEDIDNYAKEETKARYELYKLDGWKAYQDFRADLVNLINKDELTEVLAFVIENYLSVAYDKIAQNGDWKTAYYKLSMLVIPEIHAFVLPYKLKAIEIIETYINENYPKK